MRRMSSSAGLSPNSPKALRGRLIFDMLGVPHGFIGAYRSGGAAKLAFERNEMNVFSESPPSYRSIIEPSLVKTGKAIPLILRRRLRRRRPSSIPDSVKGLPLPSFRRILPAREGHAAVGTHVGRLQGHPRRRWHCTTRDRLPPGAPAAAVAALRDAVARLNKDPAHAAEAQKLFGLCAGMACDTETGTVLRRAVSVAPDTRTFLVNYVKSRPK